MAGDTFLAYMLSPCTFLIGSPRGAPDYSRIRAFWHFQRRNAPGTVSESRNLPFQPGKQACCERHMPQRHATGAKSAICFSRWRLCRLTDKDSIDDSAARQKNMKIHPGGTRTDIRPATPAHRPRGPHPHGPARAGRGPGSARLPAGRAGPRSCAPAARPWPGLHCRPDRF